MSEANKSKTAAKQKQTDPSLNLDELRELADLVDEHGFTDFEFENANIRVRLSKNTPAPMMQAVQPYQSIPMQTQSAPQTQSATPSAEAGSSAEVEIDSDAGLHKITSPIVGTFYRSAAPDKPPYVEEGDQVNPSSIVCIVEAMKLMNEIESEVSGEIVKIYVENEQPVEYGQPLFGVKI